MSYPIGSSSANATSRRDPFANGALGLTMADPNGQRRSQMGNGISQHQQSNGQTSSQLHQQLLQTGTLSNGDEAVLESNEAEAWVALLSQLDGMNEAPTQGWPSQETGVNVPSFGVQPRHPWYNGEHTKASAPSSYHETLNHIGGFPSTRLPNGRQIFAQPAESNTIEAQTSPYTNLHPGATLRPSTTEMTPTITEASAGDASELLKSLCSRLTPEQRWAHVVSQTSALASMTPPNSQQGASPLPHDPALASLLSEAQKPLNQEIDQVAFSMQELSTWPEMAPGITTIRHPSMQSDLIEAMTSFQDPQSQINQSYKPRLRNPPAYSNRNGEHRISIPSRNFTFDGYRGSWIESESSSNSTRPDLWTPSAWSNSSGLPTPSVQNLGVEANRGWSVYSPTFAPAGYGSTDSPRQQQEHLFVNYTPADAATIISGVAPSGSSKKRREERAKKRMTLHMMQSTPSSVRSPTDPNHIRPTIHRTQSRTERERRLSAPATSRSARPNSTLHREEPNDHTRTFSAPENVLSSPDTGGALVPQDAASPITFVKNNLHAEYAPVSTQMPDQSLSGMSQGMSHPYELRQESLMGRNPVMGINEGLYF